MSTSVSMSASAKTVTVSPAVSSTPAQDALLRAWIWLSFHHKTRMLLAVVLTCFLCQMVNATMASAADEEQEARLNTYWLPLGNVTDSHGVPVGQYTELPLDYGNPAYPMRGLRGALLRFAWMIYTVVTYAVLALCNFVLSLEWVDWILSPFILLANTIQGLMSQTGIVGLGIFIAAITIAWGLARGKMGAAILEIAIVALFVGLVSSPIANPSEQIRSWIGTSATYGTEAGVAAVTGTEEGSEASTNPVSGQIVDIAVRSPALMLAFGSDLEGDACAQTWDDQAKSGADAEKLRKSVLGCNGDLKDANETDSFTALAFMSMSSISTGGLMALVVTFLFFIFKDVVLAGLGLINTVIRAHLAVFPGGGRQAFINAVLQLLVNVFMVGAYIFMLSLYLWLVGKLHEALGSTVMMIGNLIFGLVLIVMALTFWHLKRQGKSVAKKLAHALGGSPMNRAPELKPSGFTQSATKMAESGKGAAARQLKNRATSKALGRGAQVAAAGATGGASVAATRMAAAGWFLAGHLAQSRPGNAGPEAGSAPPTQTYRPSSLKSLPVGTSPTADNLRDANGAIPMNAQPTPAEQDQTQDQSREHNPAQARSLRTPVQLNRPTGDRVPVTGQTVPTTVPSPEPGETTTEPGGQENGKGAGKHAAQLNSARSSELATTSPTPSPTPTPTTTPAPQTDIVAAGTTESTTRQRSTLPTGNYGKVRINRNGTANTVLAGQIVEDLPAGIKTASALQVPADQPAQTRSRRQASMQTATFQMQNRSRINSAAERGEIR